MACGEIDAPSVKARDTVHLDTPARAATSLAVALRAAGAWVEPGFFAIIFRS
ncbi:hypothetical protein D3C76_1682580 [compost metagenome]